MSIIRYSHTHLAFFFLLILFLPANSNAAASWDSPTLLYSDADKSHANKMAKRGTDVIHSIGLIIAANF